MVYYALWRWAVVCCFLLKVSFMVKFHSQAWWRKLNPWWFESFHLLGRFILLFEKKTNRSVKKIAGRPSVSFDTKATGSIIWIYCRMFCFVHPTHKSSSVNLRSQCLISHLQSLNWEGIVDMWYQKGFEDWCWYWYTGVRIHAGNRKPLEQLHWVTVLSCTEKSEYFKRSKFCFLW